MADDFRPKLRAFAEQVAGRIPRCANEESAKLFLILPFLEFLGYDIRNPDEVCPEHGADFSEKYKNRVDFAILKGSTPIIAVECKAPGAQLKDDRGQLRSYFNAATTVKMGVLTDGIVYEFYADSDEPNIMDQSAFLVLDIREIAKGKIEDSIEDGIRSLQKTNFDPENIGAEAKRKLIFQNFVTQISVLAENPTEPLVRMLLQSAGLSHVRNKALSDYTDLTKNAFREFVNLRILERLDLPAKDKEPEKQGAQPDAAAVELPQKGEDGIATSPLEQEIAEYVKRRLAFLVKDDSLFKEITHVEFKKYKGKYVSFYKKERLGRLFDFYEAGERKFCVDFGQLGGEVDTDNLESLDKLLHDSFVKRVKEGGLGSKKAREAQE